MGKATDTDNTSAELIRLHAALAEQTAVLARMEADKLPPGITPESDAHEQRMLAAERHYRAIAAEITRTPANDEAGLKAKAAALLLSLEHYLCHRIGSGLDDIATGEMGDDDHRLSLSLARDIVGREPGSQDISPDAYLITLCDRIVALNAEEKEIDARHDDPDNDPIDGPRLEANAEECWRSWSNRRPRDCLRRLAGGRQWTGNTQPDCPKPLPRTVACWCTTPSSGLRGGKGG
jgi:hypothetical protein